MKLTKREYVKRRIDTNVELQVFPSSIRKFVKIGFVNPVWGGQCSRR